MQEKANETELCECCKENEVQYELKSSIVNVTYKVCGNCLQPLVCYQLEPEQFKNLLATGHNDEEFLIHGDFYDDDGVMQQPECGIDLHVARMMLEEGYLDEDNDKREHHIDYKLHHLVCPGCGNKGTIKNHYDSHGKFKVCKCSKTVKIISIEGNAMPECRVCGTIME